MLSTAVEWDLEVERGPGWLLVRVKSPLRDDRLAGTLADQLWTLIEKHLVYRIALDLSEIRLLHSVLLGQLVSLRKRIDQRGGLLRLCGLSRFNRELLRENGLHDRLPAYNDLHEAVLGSGVGKPR